MPCLPRRPTSARRWHGLCFLPGYPDRL